MPIDQLQKKRNLALRLVSSATMLMNAVNDLDDLSYQYTKAGMQFADNDFIFDGLRHLDAASAGSVLFSSGALKTWLDTENHTTNFEKARP